MLSESNTLRLVRACQIIFSVYSAVSFFPLLGPYYPTKVESEVTAIIPLLLISTLLQLLSLRLKPGKWIAAAELLFAFGVLITVILVVLRMDRVKKVIVDEVFATITRENEKELVPAYLANATKSYLYLFSTVYPAITASTSSFLMPRRFNYLL